MSSLTCDSISSFLNLMRDIPEKSMVSVQDETELLDACPSLQRSCGQVRLFSPFSSRCSWPVLVDATTLAAIWFTWREACWRVVSLVLWRSALTCRGEHMGETLNLMNESSEIAWKSNVTWLICCHVETHLIWAFEYISTVVRFEMRLYLWGSNQLCRAGSDLVGADNQLFIFAGVQHHLISRLPVRKQVKTQKPRQFTWSERV